MKLYTRIVHDPDAENPRNNENVGCLQISSRRSISIDETNGKSIAEDNKEVFCRLPVFRMEHGNVSYNTVGYSCRWDSGQVGWIVAYKADVLTKQGFARRTKENLAKVLAGLVQEVEEFSMWANGDCWGFIVEDETGDTVDSCFGYIGIKYAEESAAEALQSIQKEQKAA